ncbi:hypothetical protein DPV78_007029 [Talaromyces pinophilus]|nr:hypothetical protein DPV78_007029 [Talaromyces pinophilus]
MQNGDEDEEQLYGKVGCTRSALMRRLPIPQTIGVAKCWGIAGPLRNASARESRAGNVMDN